jgi:hypothetical protein
MKALTIKQPWASLIARGIKDVENRTWRTNYRGRIYIHASANKKLVRNDLIFSGQQLHEVFNAMPKDKVAVKWFETFPLSAIIGEVDIVDCVLNHPSIWAERFFRGEKPLWNWELANPVLYDEPILNVKGKLSFWEFDNPKL